MKEQLVSYKTARLAKEVGFRWKTMWHFTDRGDAAGSPLGTGYSSHNDTERGVDVPSQSVLQKWLRDKHYISIEILDNRTSGLGKTFEIVYGGYPNYKRIVSNGVKRDEGGLRIPPFPKYEQALEAALQEALKLTFQKTYYTKHTGFSWRHKDDFNLELDEQELEDFMDSLGKHIKNNLHNG